MYELAPYACRSERGRAVPEADDPLRGPFQRDRDRVVHATAFRRLEYKTQVLVNFEGDHFRTRLTHSLEVAQIARTVARALKLDEDLAEAVALAHDLGHSAFGHAGEDALHKALAAYGGFDHNVQTFRVLTSLERRYARFDGLNLTFEALEGVVKHNGPLPDPPQAIACWPHAPGLRLGLQAPLEAQVAAVADDVAYTNHDLDDGLRAGFLRLDDLRGLPVVAEALREAQAAYPQAPGKRLAHETIRRVIGAMVTDMVEETRRRLALAKVETCDDARDAAGPLVGFSPEMTQALAKAREFLHRRVYRHYKINRMTLKAQRLIGELVEAFLAAPETLPERWFERAGRPGSQATAEAVRDYVAGMTDRFALEEHDRLFKLTRDPS